MKLSLKPACPDCGKRSLWLNYLFRRYCPHCKTEFTATKYSIISACIIFAIIAVMPALGIVMFGYPSNEDVITVLVISTVLAVAIFPLGLNLKFISKKTGKELYPPKKPTLLQNYQSQTLLLAFAMSFMIFLFFLMSRYFKLFLPDYMLEPYPPFTKIILWLIPSTMGLVFATALVIALGYFLFGAILLKNCSKRKLFSCGIKFFTGSYKLILFITVFTLAGLLMPLIPYCLQLPEKAGLSAIEISNNILCILFFAIPIFIWFFIKKINSNHSLSLLNRKLILFALINPLFIVLLILGELIIIRKVVQPVLIRYRDLGFPIMELIAGENLIYGILSLFVLICIYFIFLAKECHKKRKFFDRIQFFLYANSFSLLVLASLAAALTACLTNFLSIFIRGCAYCRAGGLWSQKTYPNINWLALGIVITVTIFVFILSKKIKYRNKCKWVYLTGVLLFAIFYFPVNKKIHPAIIRMGFIDKQGKLVIAPKFINFYNSTFFKSGLCNVYLTQYSLWSLAGFINKKGVWVIAPKFELAYPFSDGFSHIVIADNNFKYQHGFINSKGKYIEIPKYFKAHSFSNGLALVEMEIWKRGERGYGYGYINTKGKLVIQNLDSKGGHFSEGLAWVKVKANLKGQVKEIKTPKKIVIDNEEPMFYNEKQRIEAFDHEMVTFIDKLGKFAIKNKDKTANPMIFLEAGDFSEGLAWVKINITSNGNDSMFVDNKKNSKVGFIDKSGTFLIKPQFHYAKEFSEGLAPVKLNGAWGFVNKKGELAVKFKYAEVYAFSGGLARVYSRNKYGFIDKSGEEVIPVIYEYAKDFSEGLAAVQKDGSWGYIDKTGKFVIKPQFYNAQQFSEGLAAVSVKIDY